MEASDLAGIRRAHLRRRACRDVHNRGAPAGGRLRHCDALVCTPLGVCKQSRTPVISCCRRRETRTAKGYRCASCQRVGWSSVVEDTHTIRIHMCCTHRHVLGLYDADSRDMAETGHWDAGTLAFKTAPAVRLPKVQARQLISFRSLRKENCARTLQEESWCRTAGSSR